MIVHAHAQLVFYFTFLQAVEQVESASATRGYCAREKEEVRI
jgi:hypothetical protein